MLEISCCFLSPSLMGSKLLKTTEVWGSGPSSHSQSDVQLVVEETEGIRWVVTAIKGMGEEAESLGPMVNKRRQQGTLMGPATDQFGIP